jgi:osmotically-inducible protein OsmY
VPRSDPWADERRAADTSRGPWTYNRREDYTGRGPKNYRRPDERILEDVSDRLTDDAMVDASDITVEVNAGEVTLSGTVRDRDQKRRAEDLAERVSGVKDVINALRIAAGGKAGT